MKTTGTSCQFRTAFTHSSALYRTAFAALVMVAAPMGALALPQDGQVSGGSATITQTGPTDMVINQSSDRAVIDWRSFNINNGESTRFIQPGAGSVALNRIWDGNPTQILGSLSANGKLVIVNPNGVFFGAGSRVDVGGLIATTADMSNSQFMAGSTHFNIPGRADASIVNKGTITAAEGGLVALVAPAVRNDGLIQARSGAVRIGGAETFTVDFYGDNLFSFSVGQKPTAAGRDENGQVMKAAVENNGTISANGGSIVLTANAAKEIVTHAVNNTGVLEAQSARMVNGSIVLDGGEGNVRVAGKVDASGKHAGQKGGSIAVTGKNIQLAGAKLDASGHAGGGSVKVGGDYQGGGSLARAKTVYMDANSTIDVSAQDVGHGGAAVLWSDEATQFDGTIFARGGANGGNGGVVETSGGSLGASGFVYADAANGNAGSWLLDPRNIVIRSALGNSNITCVGSDCTSTGNNAIVASWILEAALNLGTNVTILTGATGTQDGDITVQDPLNWVGAGSLTLTAHDDIFVNANINSLLGSLTLNANDGVNNALGGNGIIFNNALVNLGLGNATLNTTNVALNGKSGITTALGNIVINNSGTFFSALADTLNAAVQGVTLRQSTNGSIQNAINAVGTTGLTGAKLTLGTGTFNQFFAVDQSNFTVTGQGQGVTIIKPGSLEGATGVKNGTPWGGQVYLPVVLAKNGDLINFSNFTVDASSLGGSVAAVAYQNAGGFITDVTTKGGTFGLYAVSDSTQGHGEHTILATNVNASGANWAAGAFIGDKLSMHTIGGTYDGTAGQFGVDFSNGAKGSITNATVKVGGTAGIGFHGAHDVSVIGGTITGTGTGTGILDDHTGYGVPAASKINVLGVTIADVVNGIRAVGGSAWNIVGGSITGMGVASGKGISFESLTGTNSVSGVTVAKFTDGIALNNTDSVPLTGNTINTTVNAIHLENGSDSAVVTGNTVNGAYKGVLVESSGSETFIGNTLNGISGLGFDLLGSPGATLIGNNAFGVAGNAGYGIRLLASDGSTLTANGFTDFGNIGIWSVSSNGITLAGNAVKNSLQGIVLDNSESAKLLVNTVDNSGSAAIFANDSSKLTLTGNILTNVKGDGIDLRRVSQSEFTGNVITSVANNISSNSLTGAVGGSGITSTFFDDVNYNGNSYTTNVITGFGSSGIRINGVGNTTLKTNVLTNNTTGIALTYGANNNTLDTNFITGGTTGIATAFASNNVMKNNVITGVSGDGIVIGAGAGSPIGSAAMLTGNIITAKAGNTASGIRFDGADQSSATGKNVVTGFGNGVAVINGNDILIDDNILLGNTTGVFVDPSTKIVVNANLITGGVTGVHVLDSGGTVVSKNVLGLQSGDGIFVENSPKTQVTGNILGATGGSAIHIKGSDGTVAKLNTSIGSATGIEVEGSKRVELDTNTLLAAGNGISATESNRLNAHGNTIAATNDGIVLNRSHFATLTDNVIGAVRYGINALRSHDLTSNNSTVIAGTGVHLDRSDDATVNGGSITALKGNGIEASRSDRLHVKGGKTTSLAANGIVLDRSDDAHVTNGAVVAGVLGNGIDATLSNGLLVKDSHVGGGVNGIKLDRSNKARVTDDSVVVGLLSDGIDARRSNGLRVKDSFVGGGVNGITLDRSDDARITDGSIVAGLLGNGIDASRSDGLRVKDSVVGGGLNGVKLYRSDDARITDGSLVVGLLGNAVDARRSDGLQVTDSYLLALLGDGVRLDRGDGAKITGNGILAGRDGVNFSRADGFEISGNTVDAGRDGIRLRNADNGTLSTNVIEAKDNGIRISDSRVITASTNTVTGANTGIFVRGGSDNVELNGNTLNGNKTGIRTQDSNNIRVLANILTDNIIGIVMDTVTGGRIADNILTAIAGVTGISVTDSPAVTIARNTLTGYTDGIGVKNSGSIPLPPAPPIPSEGEEMPWIPPVPPAGSGLTLIEDNIVYGNGVGAGVGISVVGSDGVVVRRNQVSNTNTGVSIVDSDGLAFSANRVNSNFIGLALASSDDAVLTGDIFIGNTLGISLDNSQRTFLDTETIVTPAGGTGIQIANGSGATRVRNALISGGDTGILIDGAGSSMQFVDNNSRFSGMGFYFVLQNEAMKGETLDASQQFFNGKRASEFSYMEWLAAEAKTIDDTSRLTVGDVFYKNYPTDGGLSALDDAERKRKGLYRAGLFSYAGRTLYNNIEVKPFNFEISTLGAELSLLNRGGLDLGGITRPNIGTQQTPAGIANFFASLTPAAGGKNPGASGAAPSNLAQQLAALKPGAGGNKTTSPAAGGSVLGSCGNSFLDSGATLGFNAGSCQ